jgi:hypothetical protein
MLSSNLQAQIGETWNPGATSPAYWETPANWGGAVPGPGYKVYFNSASATPCIVDQTSGGCQLSMGDGGGPATLVVTNGGNLTCGDTSTGNLDNNAWTAIGYSAAATMIIDPGATVTFNYHLWIGLTGGGNGTLIMNGGTATLANVNAAFGIGTGGGQGMVNLYGGTLNINNNIQLPNSGAQINLAGGTLLINGNATGNITTYTNAGKIVAYGGAGTVVFDYNITNPGQTTVTGSNGAAVPAPAISSITVGAGDNVTITYTSQNNAQYHIQSSTSLSPSAWNTVPGSSVTASGASTQFNYTDTSGSAAQFYRVVVGP